MNQSDVTLAITFSVIFSILLLGGMVMIAYTAHRTRLRHQLKLSKAQTQYEQELRAVSEEVQEHMLANISGELHDNIGQRLTLVHFQLEAQRKKFQPELLLEANRNLVDAMKEVRLLSHSMNADMLKRKGLQEMVAQEARRLAHNGKVTVRLEQQPDTEPDLGPDQQLMAFRLFQEAVNNALKHAQAHNLWIRMENKPAFCLEVDDDGKGFDPVALAATGAGLSNMQQRAQLAGLRCLIRSSPGKGCTVSLKQAVV